MSTIRRCVAGVGLGVAITIAAFVSSALARDSDSPSEREARPLTIVSDVETIVSSRSSNRGLAKAPTDTFQLYGGPGTDEGKFQSGLIPDRQGWTGHDLTFDPIYWQLSTFNAENLNSNGAGNTAAWCGQTAAQQPGWTDGDGYGNKWFQMLQYEETVSNPAAGQTVGLEFHFNHETENAYDYFVVQYDSAGVWNTVYSIDGTNKNAQGQFPSPGVEYPGTTGTKPILFRGSDYGGPNQDEIRIRLVVDSDVVWSDQDGLFPTQAGAVQVDDIRVTSAGGTSFTDFESGYGDWRPERPPFAGDFFDVYGQVDDLDPCVRNTSPVAGFIDYGQVAWQRDPEWPAADDDPPFSTGGTLSNNWNYGIDGGWVVNYNYGVSQGLGFSSLDNEMWSPEIAWDLPGTADDGADVVGARLRWDLYDHLPLLNGFFHTWAVRSTADGVVWSDWEGTNFAYYSNVPRWEAWAVDITEYLVASPQAIQVALGVSDLADLFGFPGSDATPAPLFDNVAVQKYQVGGPVMSVRSRDLSNDSFPSNGSIDASTSTLRDQLDVRFDMARDVSTGTANIPGDSLVISAVSRIPGATLADKRMVWVLDKNPLFEDALRASPARSVDENVDTSDPLRWTGEVVGQDVYTSGGTLIADNYFFDLPDFDFLYPGDLLRYYFRAEDSDGRVSTLPEDVSGFLAGQGYDRAFTVRALPSIQDAAGTQPSTLVVNANGRLGNEEELEFGFDQFGLFEGVDYDTYTVQDATNLISNGIGSSGAHGANADQLRGYDTIFFLAGDRSLPFSDGMDRGRTDKSDDLGLLTDWHALPGPRNVVYFGSNIASSLESIDSAGEVYLASVMGVSLISPTLGEAAGFQTAPVVVSVSPWFVESFVAYGGCSDFEVLGATAERVLDMDHIEPLAPAVRGHGFTLREDLSQVHPLVSASVVYDRTVDGDRKVDITFPFSLAKVYHRNDDHGGTGISARSELLLEIDQFLGTNGLYGDAVSVPDRRAFVLEVHPSPFNPRTTISLYAPTDGDYEVEVFDLRGRRVRVLHAGPLTSAGEHSWIWDGRDDSNASVASGVYVIRATGEGLDLRKKAVLLK